MLTSLLDMFTIILIFLIVSFEAEDQDFKLHEGIKLPQSSARSVFKPAVRLVVTPNQVIVEDEVIATLEDGTFPESLHDEGKIPEMVEFLEPRFEAIQLDAELKRERGEKIEEEDQAIILVQADKSIDYDTLYLVLRSASVAGFHKYRLAIMKK
jgi:biopolymer transport protein ExbD